MTDAQETTPALGWKAAREAAAETVRAILVRDGDHTQARQPECADKMFKYAEELPAAIRALPAPTSAQLLAEAMRPRYRRADLPVRVKPLVWVDNGDGWMMADGVGVQYWAEKGLDVSKHNAHHDARIRAALEE